MGSRRSCGWWLLLAPSEAGCVSTPLARELVDAVRTASDEVWSVFLREFKRWCASEALPMYQPRQLGGTI